VTRGRCSASRGAAAPAAAARAPHSPPPPPLPHTPPGFRNFYPKGSKPSSGASKEPAPGEAKPSGGGSGGGGAGGPGGDPSGGEVSLRNNLALAVLLTIAYTGFSAAASGGPRPQEISFQEFKSQLLGRGAVARLEVANGNLVRVFVRPSAAAAVAGPAPGGAPGAGAGDAAAAEMAIGGGAAGASAGGAAPDGSALKYTFVIGSVDSFERKLDEAQRELGIPTDAFVPVKYVSEISVLGTLLEMAPTLLFLGWAYWLLTRQMRQMPGGGGFGGLGRNGKGGLGGRGGGGGFFGMVKANVGTLDKNAKDKVGLP
jgi:AFG3 family protein